MVGLKTDTMARLAATHASPVAAAGASASISGTPETLTDGTNTLILSQVELVLRRIELHRTAAAECGDGPATANPGQPNERLVEQSIRSSLNAFEDDDRGAGD